MMQCCFGTVFKFLRPKLIFYSVRRTEPRPLQVLLSISDAYRRNSFHCLSLLQLVTSLQYSGWCNMHTMHKRSEPKQWELNQLFGEPVNLNTLTVKLRNTIYEWSQYGSTTVVFNSTFDKMLARCYLWNISVLSHIFCNNVLFQSRPGYEVKCFGLRHENLIYIEHYAKYEKFDWNVNLWYHYTYNSPESFWCS